ncbi:MAG TPA: 7-cyano-7-deazaguanine synthase [Candidatus Obscuribacterales bacterium]
MRTPATEKGISLPSDLPRQAVSVLTSGGLYSAVLLAQALDHFQAVYPIYGRFGLPWQDAEEQHLRRYLAAIRGPRLARLKVLDLPVDDIYRQDGSIAAVLGPESHGHHETLHVTGRDVLLISKAAVWSAVNGIEVFASGPITSGDIPDHSDSFFDQLESFIRVGLGQPVSVIRPFAGLIKSDVLELGRDLPLDLTFSCIRPVALGESGAAHCGRCHKCIERRQAFLESGLPDRTRYAFAAPCEAVAG